MDNNIASFYRHASQSLLSADPTLYGMIEEEYVRQTQTLSMVASCSLTDPSVLACEGSFISNVTAEGYPGARYHGGCEIIDKIEDLAIARAKDLFKATYANVQPLSASIANQIVISSLLQPGDTLLGLGLDSGGHLSHGAPANISGRHFNAVPYGLDNHGKIDYGQLADLARAHKPKLIIAGTTAYPRTLEFHRFREIADAVGAYLLADITHIAGLVATGRHPSPIDFAHITTTCTHKQLYGPRGGLILMGKDRNIPSPKPGVSLATLIDRGVFPLYQGAPVNNTVAAKARVFALAKTSEFHALTGRIVSLAKTMASGFLQKGIVVISEGTDNHIVLIEVLSSFGCTGIVAQKALERCGIIVNKNRIVNDTKPVMVASGIRFGTNSAAARAFDDSTMLEFVKLVCDVLHSVVPTSDTTFEISEVTVAQAQRQVRDLCNRFPLPGYPNATSANGGAVIADQSSPQPVANHAPEGNSLATANSTMGR